MGKFSMPADRHFAGLEMLVVNDSLRFRPVPHFTAVDVGNMIQPR
jgi:hypothetical protein